MSDDWALSEDETLVIQGKTLTGTSFAADVSIEMVGVEGRPNWSEILQRGEMGYTGLRLAMIVAGLAHDPIALCQAKKFYAAAGYLAEATGIAPPPPADEDIVGPSDEAIALLGQLEIQYPRVVVLTGPSCNVRLVCKGPGTDLTTLSDHERKHLHLLLCMYAWLLLAAFDEPGFVENMPAMVDVGLTLYEEVTTALRLARSGGAMLVPLGRILSMLGELDLEGTEPVPGDGGISVTEELPLDGPGQFWV